MVIIYDTKDKELPVGTFDTQQGAAIFLGVQLQAIKMALWRDALIFKRYKIIYYKNKILEDKIK